MSQPSSDVKHILIMDDTLGRSLAQIFHIHSPSQIFGDNPLIDCALAVTPEHAEIILSDWQERGIKPDAICADYLFGEHNGVEVLAGLTHRHPSQAKLFVHSKSGLNTYDSEKDRRAHELAKKIGAEYFHTDEIWCLTAYLNKDFFIGDNDVRTTTFREFANQAFGLDVPATLGSDILKKQEQAQRDQDRIARGPLKLDEIYEHLQESDSAVESLKLFSRLNTKDLKNSLRPMTVGDNSEFGLFRQFAGGAASGYAAFNREQVEELHEKGKEAILVLQDFKPDQLPLIKGVDGIVLLGNGATHLQIICENFGIPGIFRFAWHNRSNNSHKVQLTNEELILAKQEGSFSDSPFHQTVIRYGDPISFDTREVIDLHYLNDDRDEATIVLGQIYDRYRAIQQTKVEKTYYYRNTREVADQIRLLGWHRFDKRDCNGLAVKINADTPGQIKKGIRYGAEGVGLLRTEHMLMEDAARQALLGALLGAKSTRPAALAALQEMQTEDFLAIFDAASQSDKPNFRTTVRLLDSKPQELLPPADAASIPALAVTLQMDEDTLKDNLTRLRTSNERGVQSAKLDPQLYRMQIEAICQASKESGYGAIDILVPMVKTADDMRWVKQIIQPIAQKHGLTDIKIGAMIETRESVSNAKAIAKESDFLSFGTNDLTTALIGVERDDILATDQWIRDHLRQSDGKSPFRAFSQPLKEAITQVVTDARSVNKSMPISVCGDQVAHDEASVSFCQSLDLAAISVPASTHILVPAFFTAAKAAAAAKLDALKARDQKIQQRS